MRGPFIHGGVGTVTVVVALDCEMGFVNTASSLLLLFANINKGVVIWALFKVVLPCFFVVGFKADVIGV
jgi:hypothetical protein